VIHKISTSFKLIILLTLLFILPAITYGKINPDKYQKIISGSFTIPEKSNAYYELAQYFKNANYDSADYYKQKGYEYCIKNNYKEGIVWMELIKLVILAEKGNLETALNGVQNVLKVFEKQKDTVGIIKTYHFNGTLLGKKGKYVDATNLFISALTLSKKINSKYLEGMAYMKLAILNEQIGNLEKASSYYNILMLRPSNDSFVMSEKWTIINNMGIISAKEGNLRAAINNFKTVYDSTKSRKELLESNVLSVTNLGHAYSILEKRDSAIFYLKIAENSVKAYHQPERYVQVIGLMASEIMKDKPIEAIAYVKEAIKMCNEMGYNPHLKSDLLKLLSEIYYDQGKYKESVDAMHEHDRVHESVYDINIATEVNNLQAIHELKESKAKVKELTLAKENIQLQNKLALVIVGALIILVIVGLVYYTKMKRYNKQLSENYVLLQNSDKIKNKLFSIIGHDLKGPVGNASMILEMYLDESVDEKEKEKILDILRNLLTSTYETLDKILSWGSASIKGITCSMKRFSPVAFVASNCRLIEASAFKKSITVNNNITDCPDLNADSSHFDFVLRNLLNNALKFTNQCGIIDITCTTKPNTGMVIFCISDNGIGIQKENLSKLFSPSIISRYGTNNEKGTGIGLTLCKEYITENGGEIWVESEYGKGSSFYFSLKAA